MYDESYKNVKIDIGDLRITVMTGTPYYSVYSSVWNSEPHKHLSCELHYLREGSCLITGENGAARVFEAENLCLILPNTLHGVRQLSERVTCSSIYFSIRRRKQNGGEKSSDYAAFSEYLASGEGMLFPTGCERCFPVMNDWISSEKDGSRHGIYLTRAYLTLLFANILDAAEAAGAAAGTPDIPEITPTVSPFSPGDSISIDDERRYIIENFLNERCCEPELTISELALRLNLSRKQTERVTLRLTGSPFRVLLRRRRVEYAVSLMETTDYSLEQIARLSGYQSYGGFYTAYRGIFGASPCLRHK